MYMQSNTFHFTKQVNRQKTHLESLAYGSNDKVDRDNQNHYSKASKDGWSQSEPQEYQGDDDLQRSGPDHVEVRSEVHEALGIHRHEVDYLSHCAGLASFVAQSKSLGRSQEEKRGY